MGRRTQLICIWIFICQQTNRKDIAGQSAKLDTWERLKKTAPRWCCLQPALKANPVAKFKVELPALQRWGRSEERGDQRKGELHWARQMFERPQDDESQPEQWAVQGGVRLQLADWLATSLANTTEILYSIFVIFFSCLWFTAWCATHSSSSCKCPLQSTTQTLIFSFLIINLTN